MHPISRRSFGKLLIATGLSGRVLGKALDATESQQILPPLIVPDEVAGRRLTGEEKDLAGRFLIAYENAMAPLRRADLAYGVAPSFRFNSPPLKATSQRSPERSAGDDQ